MTAPRDVLAVIEGLAVIVRADNGSRYAGINALLDAADKARAAVAELIEASRALRAYVDVSTINNSKRTTAGWVARVERLDAAMAKVQP